MEITCTNKAKLPTCFYVCIYIQQCILTYPPQNPSQWVPPWPSGRLLILSGVELFLRTWEFARKSLEVDPRFLALLLQKASGIHSPISSRPPRHICLRFYSKVFDRQNNRQGRLRCKPLRSYDFIVAGKEAASNVACVMDNTFLSSGSVVWILRQPFTTDHH